jgi:hypothetical protein
MKPVVWMTLIAIPLLLVGVLFWALNSTSYSAMPETPLLMQTATCCPRVTQEPFWVEPVTSPTDLLSQDVRVYLGNCRGVTVTVETGTLAATYRGGCLPHSVNITLWPNTTYHPALLLRRTSAVRSVDRIPCFPVY